MSIFWRAGNRELCIQALLAILKNVQPPINKKMAKGFTAKYEINRLVYFEAYADVQKAIAREKQLKRYKREYKYNLIEHNNPNWDDISAKWFDWNFKIKDNKLAMEPTARRIPGQARDDSVYLGLGANLPWENYAPEETLQEAIMRLPQYGFAVQAVSPFYQSPPWLGLDQPDYVNAVVAVQSELDASTAMQNLLQLEEAFGRQRSIKNASRTLDIDIIDWRGEVIAVDGLAIPHPYLTDRAFVLMPLHDLAPDWQHPVTGKNMQELIAECEDCRHIQRLHA